MSKEMQYLPADKALAVLADPTLVWEAESNKIFTHESENKSIRIGIAKDTVIVDYHGPDTYGVIFINSSNKRNKEALELFRSIRQKVFALN